MKDFSVVAGGIGKCQLDAAMVRLMKKMRYIGNTLKGADLKNSATLQS